MIIRITEDKWIEVEEEICQLEVEILFIDLCGCMLWLYSYNLCKTQRMFSTHNSIVLYQNFTTG